MHGRARPASSRVPFTAPSPSSPPSPPLPKCAQVAAYPRVFLHDPVRYIGPRLAYLKTFSPGGVGLWG